MPTHCGLWLQGIAMDLGFQGLGFERFEAEDSTQHSNSKQGRRPLRHSDSLKATRLVCNCSDGSTKSTVPLPLHP